MPLDREIALREAAMAWVGTCAGRSGGVVSRRELEVFEYDGMPLKLIDHSRGIRNPVQLAATISVMHSPSGPYDDDVETADGLLRYAYRAAATDSDNRKLREAQRLGLPFILLRKIADGVFVPIYPVYVVEDRPTERCFILALDESLRVLAGGELDEPQRRYAERVTRQRLHQTVFRARVIRAYGQACGICRLRHIPLLDAAHILPDTHPQGRPVVSNGIGLCKIHHAAFDHNILGIRPDLKIEVRPDILAEVDGPMLRHGLQEMSGVTLAIPVHRREQPDVDGLEERYAQFRAG